MAPTSGMYPTDTKGDTFTEKLTEFGDLHHNSRIVKDIRGSGEIIVGLLDCLAGTGCKNPGMCAR